MREGRKRKDKVRKGENEVRDRTEGRKVFKFSISWSVLGDWDKIKFLFLLQRLFDFTSLENHIAHLSLIIRGNMPNIKVLANKLESNSLCSSYYICIYIIQICFIWYMTTIFSDEITIHKNF